MSLFKGFSQIDLLERQPRTLCAILAEQLALSNKAIEAQNEEIRQLRAEVKALSAQHKRNPTIPPHDEEDDICEVDKD